MKRRNRITTSHVVALLVLLVTVSAYLRVLGADFVNYDDETYVTANPHVQSGLTREGLLWAFNVGYEGNWHPLTWLSHMLDCRLFGRSPIGPHAVNLLLHLANTLLLLLLLNRMTGSLSKSAFAAVLFGVHPLHVESVAWIAERKDVLSALFWFLTLWAYVRYSESLSPRRYGLTMGFFALGLMSKPTLITLPLVLLLLDYWPLGRWSGGSPWRLIREKIPLLAMSLASGIITVAAQHGGGAIRSMVELPLSSRVANAVVAYISYIAKMLWPAGLAVFYPHPGDLPMWHILAAVVFLAAVTVLVIRSGRGRPYLVTGWFWYLIVLMPMIGLVQVGDQSLADRYTYISLTGLFVMVAWGMGEWAKGRKRASIVPGLSAILITLALAGCTWRQTGYWRDSVSLWTHALDVTAENAVGHYNLGVELQKLGRTDESIGEYEQAIRINPKDVDAHNNLGEAYSTLGRLDEAIEEYKHAIAADPRYANAYNGLGAAYGRLGRTEEAVEAFSQAVSSDPDLAEAQANLAVALFADGRYAEAWEQVRVCEQRGAELPEGFLDALSSMMRSPE